MTGNGTSRPPIRCRVRSYDPGRGTAVLIDERGRRIRLNWEILKHGPTLLRGLAVEVFVDQEGRPAKVTLA